MPKKIVPQANTETLSRTLSQLRAKKTPKLLAYLNLYRLGLVSYEDYKALRVQTLREVQIRRRWSKIERNAR